MPQIQDRSLVSLAWLLGGITFISIVILATLTIGVYGVSRALSVRPTPNIGDRITFTTAYIDLEFEDQTAYLVDYGRSRRPTLMLNTTSAGLNCAEWIAYAQYLADRAAGSIRPYLTDGKLDRTRMPESVFAEFQAYAAAGIEMTDRYDECQFTSAVQQ